MLWLCLLSVVALTLATPGKATITDAIGLVAVILVWQLHTRAHEGLVQMWRFTKGVGTSREHGWPPSPPMTAEETAASDSHQEMLAKP